MKTTEMKFILTLFIFTNLILIGEDVELKLPGDYDNLVTDSTLADRMNGFYSGLMNGHIQLDAIDKKADIVLFEERLGHSHSFRMGRQVAASNETLSYFLNFGNLLVADKNGVVYIFTNFTDLWIKRNNEWKVIPLRITDIEVNVSKQLIGTGVIDK